jgi:hypothetical protein
MEKMSIKVFSVVELCGLVGEYQTFLPNIGIHYKPTR